MADSDASSITTSTTYGGGGTYIVRSGDTIHTPRGAMLSHVSRIYHAGNAITRGMFVCVAVPLFVVLLLPATDVVSLS